MNSHLDKIHIIKMAEIIFCSHVFSYLQNPTNLFCIQIDNIFFTYLLKFVEILHYTKEAEQWSSIYSKQNIHVS
jgi:hypothetical protein